MYEYKAGAYRRGINRFVFLLLLVLALCLGVGLALPGMLKGAANAG